MLTHLRRLSFDPASRDFAAHLKRRSSHIVWVAIQMSLSRGKAFAPPQPGDHTVYTALFHHSNLEAMALLIGRMRQLRALMALGGERIGAQEDDAHLLMVAARALMVIASEHPRVPPPPTACVCLAEDHMPKLMDAARSGCLPCVSGILQQDGVDPTVVVVSGLFRFGLCAVGAEPGYSASGSRCVISPGALPRDGPSAQRVGTAEFGG